MVVGVERIWIVVNGEGEEPTMGSCYCDAYVLRGE